MNGNHQIDMARMVASAAHAALGQRRKYTFEPYIVHPAAVAQSVENAGGSVAEICAAWLHDVVEDTQITLPQIRAWFGPEIAGIVEELTNCEKEAGNRRQRLLINKERLRTASAAAKTIKLADILDNVPSICRYAPDFADLYVSEKLEVLPVLVGGDDGLWKQVEHLLRSCERNLRDAA